MYSENNTKYYKIAIIVLLIIILLLVFFNRNKVGKINNYPLPTGNIDFFDIDVHAILGEEEVLPETLPKTGSKTGNKNSGTNTEKVVTKLYSINGQTTTDITTYDEEKDKEVFGRVFVDDKNGDYLYQQKLAIFENSAFEYETKICPGVSNTYNFVVHNSSNMNIKYYIEMYEESEYDVNMKYRLKRNNSYVIGNDTTWVTAEELKTEFEAIGISESDSYSLDWKWEYEDGVDDKDTIAGENMTSEYKLNIRVHFEETV